MRRRCPGHPRPHRPPLADSPSRCHDKCVTKVGAETAYKGQTDWVCPACKLVAEAVATAHAEHGAEPTPALAGAAGASSSPPPLHPALLE